MEEASEKRPKSVDFNAANPPEPKREIGQITAVPTFVIPAPENYENELNDLLFSETYLKAEGDQEKPRMTRAERAARKKQMSEASDAKQDKVFFENSMTDVKIRDEHRPEEADFSMDMIAAKNAHGLLSDFSKPGSDWLRSESIVRPDLISINLTSALGEKHEPSCLSQKSSIRGVNLSKLKKFNEINLGDLDFESLEKREQSLKIIKKERDLFY